MKIIIAGGRDYYCSAEDYTLLNILHRRYGFTEVVHGGADGADKSGSEWANCKKIPIREFPAKWAKMKKAAGPIRNKEMAEYADAVILFPGGKGTNSMFWEAHKAGLKIIDLR